MLIPKNALILLICSLWRCSGYTTAEQLEAKFLTQTAPYIDTVLSSQYNTLLISYNEKVESAGALQASNYRIGFAACLRVVSLVDLLTRHLPLGQSYIDAGGMTK